MIRAVPVWQPWASLVAIGAKKIETRLGPAPSTIVGERVAIHACLTQREMWRVRDAPFAEALMEAVEAGTLAEVDGRLPFGFLLATAVVAGSERMTNESCEAMYNENPVEHAFGWWVPGHYAWHLEDVRRLPAPVPFKGKQGIFFVPNELVGGEPDLVQGTLEDAADAA
jgi:hypothetical protein